MDFLTLYLCWWLVAHADSGLKIAPDTLMVTMAAVGGKGALFLTPGQGAPFLMLTKPGSLILQLQHHKTPLLSTGKADLDCTPPRQDHCSTVLSWHTTLQEKELREAWQWPHHISGCQVKTLLWAVTPGHAHA